jgi:site-specific DNA-methyltransferase (adenine-specific)
MKFDVIIGNPPYQLDTGGSGRQAVPIYNKFVEQAKKLNPRFLTMIIPSRWFSGGMGLDNFRSDMLSDRHISTFVDYANAKDCFPQNSISGGVCYFLWERENEGDCSVTSINGNSQNTLTRDLREFKVMVRYNKAVEIIRKIRVFQEDSLTEMISPIAPFAIPTHFRGEDSTFDGALTLYSSSGVSYVNKSDVTKGNEYIGKYKVLVSQTGAEHAGEPDKEGQFRVLTSSMKLIGLNDICTHSYILAGKFDTKQEAENLYSYLKSRFVRFLILQAMTSIHISKNTFQFVPIQDFTEPWTDEKLYKKYGLTEEEIAFIESMIRPMDLSGGSDE